MISDTNSMTMRVIMRRTPLEPLQLRESEVEAVEVAAPGAVEFTCLAGALENPCQFVLVNITPLNKHLPSHCYLPYLFNQWFFKQWILPLFQCYLPLQQTICCGDRIE